MRRQPLVFLFGILLPTSALACPDGLKWGLSITRWSITNDQRHEIAGPTRRFFWSDSTEKSKKTTPYQMNVVLEGSDIPCKTVFASSSPTQTTLAELTCELGNDRSASFRVVVPKTGKMEQPGAFSVSAKQDSMTYKYEIVLACDPVDMPPRQKDWFSYDNEKVLKGGNASK